jgi:hypothetical protein
VTRLRTKLAAAAAMAALLGVLAGPLFAGEPAHAACAARHHGCGTTTRLTDCCCGDPADGSTPAGPLPTKFNVSHSSTAISTASDAVAPFVATTTFRSHNACARTELRDPATLFAPLLI